LLFITFTQSILNYVPVTNLVYWIYNVAVMINIVCSILVLTEVSLQSPVWLFAIIIIIIIILVINFMQGIYNYIPETNLVSGVYIVTTGLYLQFVLHVM